MGINRVSRIILSTAVLFALLISIYGSFIPTQKVNAQSPFLFGGPVQVITFCTCSGNFLVWVGPPKAGFYSYIPGTQGYANYNMPFPRYALGIYQPPGLCLMFIGFGCSPFGAPSGYITNITGSSI